MNTQDAKNINLADYLQTLGITPCKRQGNNLWYYSPFRKEDEPSFKVSLSRNEWYDFGMGKGGNILAFVMTQHGIDDIPRALQIIAGKAAAIASSNFLSFRPNENLPGFEEITVRPLANPALLQYLCGKKQVQEKRHSRGMKF